MQYFYAYLWALRGRPLRRESTLWDWSTCPRTKACLQVNERVKAGMDHFSPFSEQPGEVSGFLVNVMCFTSPGCIRSTNDLNVQNLVDLFRAAVGRFTGTTTCVAEDPRLWHIVFHLLPFSSAEETALYRRSSGLIKSQVFAALG